MASTDLRPILLIALMICLLACASSKTSKLEQAQFALDQRKYTEAIAAATQVINKEPNNVEARIILASAYFGRSQINFLDLAEVILDLDSNEQSNFLAIAGALPADGDLDDLRSAISTLEALEGIDADEITNDSLADAAFDLGMMQVIEQFALGVYGANYHTDLDVSLITEAQATLAQTDLIDFDNHLIASGVDAEQSFLESIRQTFCILVPISLEAGFTLAEYQALVACELSDDPDAIDTTTFTADIESCNELNPDDQVESVFDCYANDTGL